MNIIVLFGVTGDLARQKVLPAITRIQSTRALRNNLHIIGVGRKTIPPTEFSTVKNKAYLSGDLDFSKTYIQLRKHIQLLISDTKNIKDLKDVLIRGKKKKMMPLHIVVYSSLPPHVHTVVAKHIQTEVIAPLSKQKGIILTIDFLVEKPVGQDTKSAQREMSLFESIFNTPAGVSHIRYVDHYLAKEPLLNVRSVARTNQAVLAGSLGSPDLREIRVLLLENKDVSERGAFYDRVGALFDVGQNHLLQLLAEALSMRIGIMNELQGVDDKKQIKKSTLIDLLMLNGSPIFGQYEGYQGEKGIEPNSKTETYFNIKAKVSELGQKRIGSAVKNLKLALISAKKSGIQKSGIQLVFKNGNTEFIDMNGGAKDAYQNIFESILFETYPVSELFAQPEEIISGWKFVMRAKKLKLANKIFVYKDLRDILA